jgi:hypothetical protein
VFVVGRPTDTATKQPVAATVTVAESGFKTAYSQDGTIQGIRPQQTKRDTAYVRWKVDNWFVIVGSIKWQLPLLPTTNQQIHIRMVAENYWPANIVATVLQPAAGQSPVMVTLTAAQTEMLQV